jgi:Fe-S cluster assembly protein SufD
MTQIAQPAIGVERYLSEFATSGERLPGRKLPWLESHRQAAIARFEELGFPTTRHEPWKYTNVAPLVRAGFDTVTRKAAGEAAHAVLPALGPFRSAPLTQLVFVNGVFQPTHSQRGTIPAGVQINSIGRALESEPEVVEKYLNRHLDYQDHAFAALNTAFLEDGALILLPDGATIDSPVHLVFLSTAAETPTIAHPRILVAAGEGSNATLIEHYMGPQQGVYFNNVVTEICAAQGAVVDHYKLQQESAQAFHIANVQVCQHRDSTVSSHSIALGGGLSRHEVSVTLDGEGADCALNGLYMMDGEQHSDHHITIDHARPHGTSRQLFKGIMNGSSRGVFTGTVVVRKDAQKISAEQMNRNLLLSDKALAESRPQLEIYADDVRCTHGSAIGRLDEDMIFYLRTRGIAERDARNLLTYAFASEILKGFKVRQFRSRLEEIFSEWLPAGRLLGGSNDRPSQSDHA